jgi:TonB family protein
MTARLSVITRSSPSLFLQLLVVILALFASSPLPAQEQPELDALAAEAAAAIHKSKKSGDTRVLVIDFAGTRPKANALGAALADRFADLLRKNTKSFVVIDRADYARATADDVLTPEARAETQSAKCYCRQLGAEFVVEGSFDASSDNLPLRLKVMQSSKDWKPVFNGTVSLPLAADLRASLSKPAASAPVSPPNDKTSWTNPDASQEQAVADSPHSSASKTSFPKCLYCPNAHFSDVAVKVRAQGTVFLSVAVSAAGQPTSIVIKRGLPCELNSQAIESVKQWRFKPAEDPNGNPASSMVMIEVNLHLY